jgi:hypothetical protein
VALRSSPFQINLKAKLAKGLPCVFELSWIFEYRNRLFQGVNLRSAGLLAGLVVGNDKRAGLANSFELLQDGPWSDGFILWILFSGRMGKNFLVSQQ